MVMEVLLLAVEGREPVRLVHIALTLALRANDQGSAKQSPARARRRQQIPNGDLKSAASTLPNRPRLGDLKSLSRPH